MPQRATNLILALTGLIAVCGLFVLGLNVYRAAGKGPLWKRRLLGAGLALLAAVGLISCSDGGEPGGGNAGGGTTNPAGTGLEASKEWRALCATWKEADEVASGKRGAYPFTRAGKKKLLDALSAAVKTVESLAGSGELSAAEAGLLKKDLAALTYGVQRKRSKEMKMATCYKPMPAPRPAAASADRLSARLPLLEKLAAGGKLHTAAVRRVLASIERDLGTLRSKAAMDKLDEKIRAKAEKTREAVSKQVEKVKARLAAPATSSLEDSKEWKHVQDAWKFCAPLAVSGKSTTRQRKAADVKMKDAKWAATQLVKKSLLSGAEAGLLCVEIDRIRKELYRNPPTDSRVTCYEMMMVVPARNSFERLQKRLPLLEKLVAAEKVNRAVTDKLLGSIEKDVGVLSNEKQIGRLTKDERSKAEAVRDAVKAEVKKLKVLVKDG